MAALTTSLPAWRRLLETAVTRASASLAGHLLSVNQARLRNSRRDTFLWKYMHSRLTL